jgi:iron(III) transport system permease protein
LQRRLTLLLAVLALAVVGLLPLVAMVVTSVFVDGKLTLATYTKLLSNPLQYWIALGHSLTLATLTAVCATALGVALGLLFGKTDLPFRRTLTVLLGIPLLLPPYVLAICWFNLLASDGLLAQAAPVQLAGLLSRALYGLPGCWWVMVSALTPAVMILTLVYLRAVNPRLEEAGRLVTRWPAVLYRVTLPLVLPGILFGGLLVFLLTLGEVGVPMFLRYPVYAVETLTQFSAFYDFGAATAAAMPLLLVTLLMLTLERRFLRAKVHNLRPSTPGRRMLRVPLGRWRIPIFLVVSLLGSVMVVLPITALAVTSLAPFAYGDAWRQGAGSLGRSLALAAAGATLLAVLGFFCGYLIRTRALGLWRALDTLTLLLFTLPGTVIGMGLIALWNRPGTAFMYASTTMVIFAYVAQYTALTSRITLATLANRPQSLEEAAQIAGAPWLARIGYIVVPAALPGVIAGWLIGFIFCVRDLGASMLVYPAGQETFSVRIFTLMANGTPSLISALCVMLVIVALSALGLLGLFLRAVAPRL